jgi:hypothetical protein
LQNTNGGSNVSTSTKKESDVGLDMYAYVATKAGQQNEYYEGAEFNETTREFENKTVTKPREIAYWRKHPNLHGWMRERWESRGNSGDFNGDELELTYEDLEILELDVIAGTLPGTTGFFFGNDADEHYREQDLEFIKNARAELFMGLKVFYNSSW